MKLLFKIVVVVVYSLVIGVSAQAEENRVMAWVSLNGGETLSIATDDEAFKVIHCKQEGISGVERESCRDLGWHLRTPEVLEMFQHSMVGLLRERLSSKYESTLLDPFLSGFGFFAAETMVVLALSGSARVGAAFSRSPKLAKIVVGGYITIPFLIGATIGVFNDSRSDQHILELSKAGGIPLEKEIERVFGEQDIDVDKAELRQISSNMFRELVRVIETTFSDMHSL